MSLEIIILRLTPMEHNYKKVTSPWVILHIIRGRWKSMNKTMLNVFVHKL